MRLTIWMLTMALLSCAHVPTIDEWAKECAGRCELNGGMRYAVIRENGAHRECACRGH